MIVHQYLWQPMFSAPRDMWIAIKCKLDDGTNWVVICAYDKKFDNWPTPDGGWLDHEDCMAWSECDQNLVSHLIATEETLMSAYVSGNKKTRERAFKTWMQYINSPGRHNINASIY